MSAYLGRDAASAYRPNSDPRLLHCLQQHLSLQITAAQERECGCKSRGDEAAGHSAAETGLAASPTPLLALFLLSTLFWNKMLVTELKSDPL